MINIGRCPRCEGPHADLATHHFQREVRVGFQRFLRWTTCPATDEPILLHPTLADLSALDVQRAEDERFFRELELAINDEVSR